MSIAFSRTAWATICLATFDTDRALSLRIVRLLSDDPSPRPVCDLPRPVATAALDAWRAVDGRMRRLAGERMVG